MDTQTQARTNLKAALSFKNFIIGLALATFVYLIMILISNWSQLVQYLGRVPIYIVILAMFLSFLNYTFRFFKWHLFTRSLDLKIPLKINFTVFFAGLALSITPAKAGEAIRAFLLQKSKEVDLSKGLASTFSERLIDLLAVTILSVIGILLMGIGSTYLTVILMILILVIVGIVVFLFDPVYNLFSKLFHIGPWSSLGKHIDKFRDDVVVTFQLPVFVSATILGIIGWSFECLGFMIIAQYLGIDMDFSVAIFIYATSSIIGAISFLPGGLGLMEGGLAFFVTDLLKVDYTLSVALTLLIRFATLWFGVGIGIIFLVGSLKAIKNNIKQDSQNQLS